MKKYVDILIFVLALVMMMLACSACRSQKTMTYSELNTDTVKLSMKDSTTNHLYFTFDSLVFSTTDLTDLTDEAAIPSGRLSVQSVRSVVNKNLPCSFVRSVVNKNLPCSRFVVYGGKLSSNFVHSVSQDSTSSKKAQVVKNTRIRPGPMSLIADHSSLIILSLVILVLIILAIKIYKNRLP